MTVALHFPDGQACWDIICKHLGLQFQNLNIALLPVLQKQSVKSIHEKGTVLSSPGTEKQSKGTNTLHKIHCT